MSVFVKNFTIFFCFLQILYFAQKSCIKLYTITILRLYKIYKIVKLSRKNIQYIKHMMHTVKILFYIRYKS